MTYAETDRNRLLLKLLKQDIVQINSTVLCLSKELNAFIQDRNFFIIMFQLRSHIAVPCNGLHSVRIDILLILNQVSGISSQKLIPTLLNPLDLISLLNKLEAQLVSCPRLTLPEWNGETIWYMYKFMKLQSFMMHNTLSVVLHIPQVDRSLQFHLFRNT